MRIGMTWVDILQIFFISLARSWYFMIFSYSLFLIFISTGIATSIMIISFGALFIMMISGSIE